MTDDAGSIGQRLEAGEVGGLVAEHGQLAGPAADEGAETLATTSGPAVAARVL